MNQGFPKMNCMHLELNIRKENILAGNSSQSQFTASDGKTATLSKGSVILTNEEDVLNAEIIQALKIVDGNFSFASANGDDDRFRTTFPDSAIAKSYKQEEAKVKCCLQYGVAPHLKDRIVKDLANSPLRSSLMRLPHHR